MFRYKYLNLFLIVFLLVLFSANFISGQGIIIDHNSCDLTQIPPRWIDSAKTNLHIAYGHTSHGSQITYGMSGLVGFINNGGLGLSYPENYFSWNNGGSADALDLHDQAMAGDAGYYPQWYNNTVSYLNDPSNSDVNVIIWSWCGQVSGNSEQEMIDEYLDPMSQLELAYPQVAFVYMTGHLDGTGEEGNLHQRNEQIRTYCQINGKVLYDFSDIESYDPDGNYYLSLRANDNCDYDSDGDGSRDANWAQDWQSAHTEGIDWFSVVAAHSQPLNGNLKAYAAWWLWARLAGWEPITVLNDPPVISLLPDTSFFEDDTLIYPIETWFAYVHDPETADGGLSYTVLPGSYVTADSGDAVYFFHAPENWFGADTLQLVVSDSFASVSSDFIINVFPVNDPPQISIPYDTLTFPNDSSATIDLWSLVFDVETADENINYIFHYNESELVIEFSVGEGSLDISPFENYSGNSNLIIEIEDEGNISVADSMIIKISPTVNIPDPFNVTIPKSYYISQNYPNPFNP
ncbi:MAG: hypothetical protein KAR38_00490, partial [Calditrichia bacterium]|nr:hypothetical protein [Calditrichia bacterium]